MRSKRLNLDYLMEIPEARKVMRLALELHPWEGSVHVKVPVDVDLVRAPKKCHLLRFPEF